MNIKPIKSETVHKICSGQVVLSLAVAVKELVENALDAGATSIDVRLKNYGIDLIEVSDNGSGVTEDNFAAMTLKYHTSKLSEYSDLLGVKSFGFRGEALSSLSALAHLTITTRHESSEYATKLEYDNKGNLVKKTPCSRQIGTTVTLSDLFFSLPVRQKELHKNVKREFNKLTQLLYAYCLISLGVKITCSNQTNSNSKTLVVATQGSNSYKDNIACVFGVKQLQHILEIKPQNDTDIKRNIFKGLSNEMDIDNYEETFKIEDVDINLSEDSNDAENNITPSPQKSQGHKNTVEPIEFTGFISSCSHGSGRSSTDRQFYYVNSRPCEPTKIMKVLNEIYKQFNPNQYPFVFLNINLERTSVDINVSPDKRKVFLTKEKKILDVLKVSLIKLFENMPRTLKVDSANSSISSQNNFTPVVDQPRVFNSFMQQFSKTTNDNKNTEIPSKTMSLKRKSTTMKDFILPKTSKTLIKTEISLDPIDIEDNCIEQTNCNNNHGADIVVMDNFYDNIGQDDEKSGIKHSAKDIIYLDFMDEVPNTQIRNLSDIVEKKKHTIQCNPKTTKTVNNVKDLNETIDVQKPFVTDKNDLGKCERKTVNMKTSLEHVKILSKMYHDQKPRHIPNNKVKFKSTIDPVFNKKCEEELSKEISKDSFKQMSVMGQFNLGFIITKLDDDLFIIDQHATDEIYNFEMLEKNTELSNQKLVIPQQLELTGVNEQVLMDKLDVFKKNGFTFEIDENAPPTKRVKLLTLPMSKNWVFGKDDIEELLFMLRESPSEYCRPSRVRAMFASRACRKSVMIGTALTKTDMKRLVDHMAEIDNPWNCPHGRPTIRHLINLTMTHTQD